MSRRYLRVKITRGDMAAGENMMKYPACWDAYEVEGAKVGPILYSGKIRAGEDFEYCLVCFRDDAVADKYLQSCPMEILELSEEAANDFIQNEWEGRNVPEEVVTDPNRIMAIMAKKMAGFELSDDDLQALDPDNPVRGINRRPKDVSIFEAV